ncbi:EKC/KEOPS complex subunit TPRKB [Panicum miliaceum]|uniref:EKC/KEOPS complex subunit TPRKB n=1 Tax=Panicum miliaceum TaxID=4540 RepID=A0A3L6TP46_PANMI|nr:EKC/KEOPS complex subunit TPRKB [Panicum miliaceum]
MYVLPARFDASDEEMKAVEKLISGTEIDLGELESRSSKPATYPEGLLPEMLFEASTIIVTIPALKIELDLCALELNWILIEKEQRSRNAVYFSKEKSRKATPRPAPSQQSADVPSAGHGDVIPPEQQLDALLLHPNPENNPRSTTTQPSQKAKNQEGNKKAVA